LIFRAVEDTDLIRQATRGNVESFNLLVSRWEKRVYNYLLRITANREDALDLTQDVFLKAYQNLRKLDDAGRFAPWLYRIAHNEAYSMFRKRRPEADVDEVGAVMIAGDAITFSAQLRQDPLGIDQRFRTPERHEGDGGRSLAVNDLRRCQGVGHMELQAVFERGSLRQSGRKCKFVDETRASPPTRNRRSHLEGIERPRA